MNEKEKADCLIALHTGLLDKFRQTRDIELKLNLSLWTLIAVGGGFFYEQGFRLHGMEILWFSLAAVAIIAGHLFFWMIPIQTSEDKDGHYIEQYRRKVEGWAEVQVEVFAYKGFIYSTADKLRSGGWSWVIALVGVTALLLSIVGTLLVWGPPPVMEGSRSGSEEAPVDRGIGKESPSRTPPGSEMQPSKTGR